MLNLVILTPLGKVFEGEVDEVIVPSAQGALGILPSHTPLISTLAPKGVLKAIKGKESIFFALYHGALEVKTDRVIVLSESAFRAASEEEAKAFLSRGREPLKFDDKTVEIGEKYIHHGQARE